MSDPTSTPRTASGAEQAAEFRERLVADLTPVRPVRLRRVVAAALAIQFGFVFVLAALIGVPPAALARLAEPPFAVMLATLALAAGLSATLAARLSVPGRFVSPALSAATLGVPVVLSVAVVLAAPWGAEWRGLLGHLSEGLHCTVEIVAVALLAWALSLSWLRRLAPLGSAMVGAFAAGTAMLQGALLIQMMCVEMDAYHLALSHLLPITAVALATAAVSGRLLSAASRPRP